MDLTPLRRLWDAFTAYFAAEGWLARAGSGALWLALAAVAIKVAQILALRLAKGRVNDQVAQLIGRGIRYAGYTAVAFTLFGNLGIDLSALLGAAGIAGIAVGFAAQTSVSNLISGLFLISEKPFAVGDVIEAGEMVGTVLSFDLLSIKLQTFDNRYVRIPNETLIKTTVVNATRFPIRRLDIGLAVAYGSDLERVRSVLAAAAVANVFALDNPEPLIVFDRFEASGIALTFGVWHERSDLLNLKNSLMAEIPAALAGAGVDIPFPRLDVRLAADRSGPRAPISVSW